MKNSHVYQRLNIQNFIHIIKKLILKVHLFKEFLYKKRLSGNGTF